MNWQELHKAIKQRSEKDYDTNAKKIMGENYNFWATFYKNNSDKLESLMECLLADMRWNDKSLTKDDEIMVRLAYDMMLSVLSEASSAEQAKKDEEEANTQSVKVGGIKNY